MITNTVDMLMAEPFKMPREYAQTYGYYIDQIEERHRNDIRHVEEEKKEADKKALEWERLYDRLLTKVVELRVENKVLQKELEQYGN